MKLTESMLRSIIKEELSTMLELDEVLSDEERKEKKDKEKRERAAKLRKFKNRGDPEVLPYKPEYFRDGQ